jgi:superkiller protein 3
MALLLLGAAYQETDRKEAAKHLRKAEKVSKEPPTVALQGLLNCAGDDEIPEILEKLLQMVPEKYSDYHTKLMNVSSKLTNVDQVIRVLEKEANSVEDKRKTSAYYCLVKIYSTEPPPEGFNELFERTLDFCLQDPHVEPSYKHDLFKKYLKLLHTLKDLPKLLTKACEMSEKYTNDIFPLEWICKIYAENHENVELFDDNLYWKMDFALNMSPNSTLVLVANGIKMFYDGKLLQVNNEHFDFTKNIICLYHSLSGQRYASEGEFISAQLEHLSKHSGENSDETSSIYFGRRNIQTIEGH